MYCQLLPCAAAGAAAAGALCTPGGLCGPVSPPESLGDPTAAQQDQCECAFFLLLPPLLLQLVLQLMLQLLLLLFCRIRKLLTLLLLLRCSSGSRKPWRPQTGERAQTAVNAAGVSAAAAPMKKDINRDTV